MGGENIPDNERVVRNAKQKHTRRGSKALCDALDNFALLDNSPQLLKHSRVDKR